MWHNLTQNDKLPETLRLSRAQHKQRQIVIPAQRRARILEIVRRDRAVSIQHLAGKLATSASTIRRDLEYLEGRSYLERTYGGAQVTDRPAGTTFEPEFEIGQHTREAQKREIGRFASTLVTAGSSVFFDSSSTVLQAAQVIAASHGDITAVTSDLNIAVILARNPRIRTIVPGGTVRTNYFTLLGQPGLSFLEGLKLDVAFIGVHSLEGEALSDSSVEVAHLKQAIMEASKIRIVLADSSKFTTPRSFAGIAPLGQVEALVTDSEIENEHRQLVEEAGVKLYVAPEEKS